MNSNYITSFGFLVVGGVMIWTGWNIYKIQTRFTLLKSSVSSNSTRILTIEQYLQEESNKNNNNQ